MPRLKSLLFAAACTVAGSAAFAQSAPQTSGTLVIVPAFGEVKHANDQAVLTLTIEEQDKDKAAAASRVNQKMKQGMDIVRKQDPGAQLSTRGYYTYAVYPETSPQPKQASNKPPQPVAWRVGQYLDVKTTNLSGLPKTVSSVQSILSVNGLRFGLADATTRKLDAQRIEATYKNLNERIVSIARAMGRNPADAVLDTVDFEGSGNYAQDAVAAAPQMMRTSMMAKSEAVVEEPSFEPGETTLSMRVVGKVRFR